MSAWSQGFALAKPKPANPWVSLGTLRMISQAGAPQPAPALIPASVAAAPAPDPAAVDAASAPLPAPDITQDPAYQARIAAILRRRDQSISDLGLQEVQTKKAYGIDDTSDPFSKAKLMQESFQRNKAATGTTLAARGQLYSGSMQNAQDANQRSFNENQDALTKAYQAAKAALAQRKTDVVNAAEDDTNTAGSDALGRLLSTRPEADLAGSQFSGDAGDAAGTDQAAPVMQTALKPKTGYSFVATSGARKGQSYNVVKSGNKVYHKYANGKTIRVK
jgi:hypothetical protein